MNCLFCNSSEIEPAVMPRTTSFNKKVFRYKRCKNCSLVFISPIPSSDDYGKMYASDYQESFYFSGEASDYTDLLEKMKSYRTDSSILDYGCGDAGFLKFFQTYGFSGTGTEYAPDLVSKLSSQNSQIRFFTIDSFWENTDDILYNFIHLGDVLEHLPEPPEAIQKISERLNPESGVLIVEGPLENNASLGRTFRFLTSWIQQKIKPAAMAEHVPYHITFSNQKNQLLLFEQAGLETLHYKIYETPWPYPSTFGGGVFNKLKYICGQASIFLSKKFFPKHGNRFVYMGKIK